MSQAELLSEVAPVSPFTFQNNPIRTQLEGETLWFAARDVCEALTIKWNGRVLSAIPAEWQGLRSFLTPSGNQQLRAITEPAVYKLAFRSNKPEADAFTNWIASEVVPSIRKTGRYEVKAEPSTTSSRKPLEKLVKVWARQGGLIHAQCWTMVNAHFGLQAITELPEAWIPDAIAFVERKIDALPKALPESEPAAYPLLTLTPQFRTELESLLREIPAWGERVYKERIRYTVRLQVLTHACMRESERDALLLRSLDHAIDSMMNSIGNVSAECIQEGGNPAALISRLAASVGRM